MWSNEAEGQKSKGGRGGGSIWDLISRKISTQATAQTDQSICVYSQQACSKLFISAVVEKSTSPVLCAFTFTLRSSDFLKIMGEH